MARLRAIVIGDKTTHGGVVLQGSHSMTSGGKPISLEGDLVACPQCKGNFPIIEGTRIMSSNGRGVALEGMRTACGAVLIASQNLVKVEDGGYYHHEYPHWKPTENQAGAGSGKGQYQIRFKLQDHSNQPYQKTGYALILPNGDILEGVTDNEGYTQTHYSDEKTDIIIRLHLDK